MPANPATWASGTASGSTRGTSPARPRDQLYVWFEPDLTPGYAWSFPLPGGRANIGFGVLRDGERRIQTMKADWDDILRRPHIVEALGAGFELEDRHTAWPIPARVDQVALTCGRTFFVGDAATVTDVMTGEGIGQALLSGRLAAESILATGATQPARATGAYEAAIRHHLVADHRMSALLGRILSTSWGARGSMRVVAASGEWGRRNFARWMFEDEPRAVLLTPSRWHRGLLRRPGAFQTTARPSPGSSRRTGGGAHTSTSPIDTSMPSVSMSAGSSGLSTIATIVSSFGGPS